MMCDRCELLEEENLQLREKLYGLSWHCPEEFKLGPAQKRILACLVRQTRPAPSWMLFEASRGPYTSCEVETGHIVSVFIFQIRRKLKAFGIEIESVRYTGYRLTDRSKAALLNWPQHQAAA